MKTEKVKICLFVRLLGLYFLLLIFGAMNIGPIGSLLKIIGFIPVAIWFFDKMSIYKSKLLTIFLFIVLWTALSYLWSINPDKTLQRIVTQCSFFMLLCSVATYIYNVNELIYLKSCLVWSSRISAVCTLLLADYHEGRLYLNGILMEDPNYLCAYFLFGIVFCLEVLFDENKTGKKKLLFIFEGSLYFYIIIATGSRGGLLSILSACAMFCMCSQKKRTISAKKILSIFIAGLILFSLYHVAIKNVPLDVLQRFSMENVIESNGTGRYTIWEDAISTYVHSTFFRQFAGYGAATAMTIAKSYGFRFVNVFHNAFIENLLELGLVGLVLYAAYIFRFWNSARKQKNYYSFSIITGLIILSLSTSISAFKPYWNIIIYIICTEYKENTGVKV